MIRVLSRGRGLPLSTSRILMSSSANHIQKCNLNCGIVGLPNVGKSSLFNALVGSPAAQAANFPFCTIEPNFGLVNVPDPRLHVLGKINKSVKLQHAIMEFVDIAGLVKGASQGAGLGNKFLSHVRSTDALVLLSRGFDDPNIIHVIEGDNGDSDKGVVIDPVRDTALIVNELILADLMVVENRLERMKKDKKNFNPHEQTALEKINEKLNDGISARHADLNEDEVLAIKNLRLLTMKPAIYAINVDEESLAQGNKYSKQLMEYVMKEEKLTEEELNNRFVIVSAKTEAEIAELPEEERPEYLSSLGVSEENSGLRKLVRVAYSTLGLQTYYTSGPTETRAWTIKKGSTAPQSAGVIHSDFERGFIRAEIINYDDMVKYGSEKACRDAGVMKSEGKDYIMKEGDIALFRFNV